MQIAFRRRYFRDLTEAARGPDAMQLLMGAIVEAIAAPTVIVHRASPIVRVRDNYDRLHYPADGAARDARYTRYLLRLFRQPHATGWPSPDRPSTDGPNAASRE